MNNVLSSSKFYSFLLALIFFIGIQNTIEAQITIKNTTSCNLIVIVSQYDYTTAIPCDQCPVNPPQFVSVGAGNQATVFGIDVCEEQWGWVAWTTSFSTTSGFGLTRNPGLNGVCGPSNAGPGCTSITTNAGWLTTNTAGIGPVTVVIF